MRQARLSFDEFYGATLLRLAAAAIVFAMCFTAVSLAQQPGQKTFSSAEKASQALATAAKNNDEKALLEIFGRDGKQIVSSGDEAEDTESRANFVERYQEMHRLVKEPDGATILYIGAHNWPTPIPLMKKGNAWYFDTQAGKKEILYRRIGRNEISAIRICQELVAAEREYSTQRGEYAKKIFADEGQQDGLYWKSASGEPESPIGPLVASAASGSFVQSQAARTSSLRGPTPYRGYYFHILTGEGKNGAKSYTANGKMTEGFAFVAYPAEYRSSGVMTFIVNQDGVLYEKDLGPKTEVVAKTMKEYDINSGWHKSEGQQEETAEQKP